MERNPDSLPAVEPPLYRSPRPAWRRWFRAPYRLLVIHTLLILAFMLTLYVDWTDFTPQPYDCIWLRRRSSAETVTPLLKKWVAKASPQHTWVG
jgi:hypothetical protein